jgi:hypothetical protein
MQINKTEIFIFELFVLSSFKLIIDCENILSSSLPFQQLKYLIFWFVLLISEYNFNQSR